MLATRRLGLAALRYAHPAHGTLTSCVKTIPMMQPITMAWIARPTLAAAYSKEAKTADSLTEAGFKLPNKDQVENFAFKSLVFFWDFAYYLFCMCGKLFETYVVNNSTVQHNWQRLLKRMEEARKELKSK